MIEEETWYVGGVDYNTVMSGSNRADVKTIYNTELGEGKVTTAPFEPYQAKIGLMYVSEYLYSANPEYWGEVNYDTLNPVIIFTENWLDIGLMDWTVSHRSDVSDYAVSIQIGVIVYLGDVDYNDFGVRPSFSLSSSVMYSEGDGSRENPFRIKI